MTAPRPRRWFQIHLSTAVVLMFVAGGLIWANIANFGWPLVARSDVIFSRGEVNERLFAWIYDFIICFAIILMTTLLCEFLARRREARKP